MWQKSDGETTRQFRNINSELWLAALNGSFNLPEALGQVVRWASYIQCELCTCHWCSVFYYVLLLLFSLYWMFLTLVSHSESLGEQSIDKIIKAASLIHCKVRAILALGKKRQQTGKQNEQGAQKHRAGVEMGKITIGNAIMLGNLMVHFASSIIASHRSLKHLEMLFILTLETPLLMYLFIIF